MNLVGQMWGPERHLAWVGGEPMRTKGLSRINSCFPSMRGCHFINFRTSSGGPERGIWQPKDWGREDRVSRPVVYGGTEPNKESARKELPVMGNARRAVVVVRSYPSFPPALCSSYGFCKPLGKSMTNSGPCHWCSGRREGTGPCLWQETLILSSQGVRSSIDSTRNADPESQGD